MKRLAFFLSVMVCVVLAGCQQSQEKDTTEVSRKDRLVGNENISLKNELKSCREEVEKQKKLVSQCLMDKEKSEEMCGENTKWLLDELPKDLLDDNTKLSEENGNLLVRIADLQKELQQIKEQQPQRQK